MLNRATDVLAIGSGGAGLWAAIRATGLGAETLLVDKGVMGRNGNTVMATG
ncbi:MAG: FAD-binding protein [Anaerolineae bacterium]